MGRRVLRMLQVVAVSMLMLCLVNVAMAQLNENCTVSVLNRTVRVNPDGSWVLPNIPANFGPVKARATCVKNGVTTFGESDFFTVPVNGALNLPRIILGPVTQIPASIRIAAGTLSLTASGQTTQLVVTATYPDKTTKNITVNSTGTNYTTSNPVIATVSANGLVTAMASGTVVIQATNDGAAAMVSVNVVLSGVDTDGDGIPDDAEIRLGLDPKNPVDAKEDYDRDGLTNLQDYLLGTDIRNPDTDGDGLSDGDESNKYKTNALLADTDKDLIPDGVEIQNATNPLDKNSYDLNKATLSSVLTPSSFVLTTSLLFPIASQQLSWKVNLIDGKTTLDLTADSRTTYISSNLTVCNFGAQKGLVLAGNPGSCTITISNGTLSVSVSATVQSFTPQALAYVDLPGYANNVDVNGNYAFVAAGSAGLQVVDVSDHSYPRVVASCSLPGNANDVIVVDNYAYVAAGSAGLQIVNISDALNPVVSASINTGGLAWDVMVKGAHAYVANDAAGLLIIDVSTPSSPRQLGSISLPGTSKGVDVDGVRQIAVVALGANGLAVVNVANSAAPVLMASLLGGDVRDLAISGNYVFLADFSRSFTSVDLTNPSSPVLRNSTAQTLGGLLQDVAVYGSFVAGADVYFINGVPLIDVSIPDTPQPRSILDFRNFRDDNGTGIAMDQSYVYLTAEPGISENGVTGTTRLYIGQYRNIQDNQGIPPTVQITSPVVGAQLVQGSNVTISANATDDVAVAAVTFFVNGQVAFTTATAPYKYTFSAPSSGSTMTLGATASDFGGNVGQALNVTLSLIPDPLTTVTGRVVSESLTPLSGASVSVMDRMGITGADGAFSIPNLSTIKGNLVGSVRFTHSDGTILKGESAPVPPVQGGTTVMGDIVAASIFTTFNFTTASVSADGTVTRFAGTPRQQYVEDLGGGVKLEMVLIPQGSFTMGSPSSEFQRFSDEGPQRVVNINKFMMGKYEVTQAQWRAVMGTNPSAFKGDSLPVDQVSWDDAQEFCQRLNARLGLSGSTGYRLPSEAEWEYAARAGTTTQFAFGMMINADIVNYHGWYTYGLAPEGILRGTTVNVGSLEVANGWGLYDMYGNIYEWCEDDYHGDYNGAPVNGSSWVDAPRAELRVFRGGSWNYGAVTCRSAYRTRDRPGRRTYDTGFRLSRNLP